MGKYFRIGRFRVDLGFKVGICFFSVKEVRLNLF